MNFGKKTWFIHARRIYNNSLSRTAKCSRLIKKSQSFWIFISLLFRCFNYWCKSILYDLPERLLYIKNVVINQTGGASLPPLRRPWSQSDNALPVSGYDERKSPTEKKNLCCVCQCVYWKEKVHWTHPKETNWGLNFYHIRETINQDLFF